MTVLRILAMDIKRKIVVVLLMGIITSCTSYIHTMDINQARVFFSKNKLVLQQTVDQIPHCKKLNIVPGDSMQPAVGSCIMDGRNIDKVLAVKMREIGVLWVRIGRDRNGDLLAATFVLDSKGIHNGGASAVTYLYDLSYIDKNDEKVIPDCVDQECRWFFERAP